MVKYLPSLCRALGCILTAEVTTSVYLHVYMFPKLNTVLFLEETIVSLLQYWRLTMVRQVNYHWIPYPPLREKKTKLLFWIMNIKTIQLLFHWFLEVNFETWRMCSYPVVASVENWALWKFQVHRVLFWARIFWVRKNVQLFPVQASQGCDFSSESMWSL